MKHVFSKRQCLLRIAESDRKKLEALLFKRYPDREWGTFFRFGYRLTSWGVHATFVDALPPQPGDLKPDSSIVEFDAGYILRAQLALGHSELGIGVAHSHPQGCSTFGSSLDDDMDAYFAKEFAMYGGGRPYLTLRVAKGCDGKFTFSGELWLFREGMRVSQLLTVGQQLTREPADHFWKQTSANVNEPAHEQARVSELLGPTKVSRLRQAVIAIVGCSGTGSPAAHVLARAGVENVVLVDPDYFTNSNHERFHASTSRDLGTKQLKVDLLRRMILDINPGANVTTIRSNILDEGVLDELLRCDLVLGCTDTQHSRAALSDYATHYLLPCIDVAVLMRAKDGKLSEQVGEFARYSPEDPCAWCLGRINPYVLRYELMSNEEREQRAQAAVEAVRRGIDGEQYWGGTPTRELTVGYMTTAVGAMLAGYAQGWLTGSFQMPHQRLQFDLGMPLLGVVPAEKLREPDCCCRRTKAWADQARADRSVSYPAHWVTPANNSADVKNILRL